MKFCGPGNTDDPRGCINRPLNTEVGYVYVPATVLAFINLVEFIPKVNPRAPDGISLIKFCGPGNALEFKGCINLPFNTDVGYV